MTIPNKKAFITILFRLTILSLIFTSFFSCTVQKRVHQKGYYVSWQGKKTQPKQIASANKRDPGESLPKIKAIELPEEKVSASVTKTETPKKPSHSLPNDSCDVLLYKDGS